MGYQVSRGLASMLIHKALAFHESFSDCDADVLFNKLNRNTSVLRYAEAACKAADELAGH